VILGFTNFILEGMETNEPQDPAQLKTDLEEIRKAGERAAALTSQLLAFSRKQIIQPTVMSIDTVVGSIEPMLRRLIGEDINLLVRRSPDLGSATVDAGQLEQVIMNLIVNARDAMPSGGKITLETANVDLDQAYAREHPSVVPGPYVMLAVSDTGFGMTPEVRERIFEPFFTTKPKGRGTGLGLATVYGIVKQSDGNVWVYSEPGVGTTFKVYLPRTSGAPESLQPKGESAVRGGHETILLVEDDERVRKLVHEMLMRSGYTVILASSPEEALNLAVSVTDRVDLLLTDVVMPGMSGRLLAERIADRHPEIRVLYMSGYTDDAIVHHGVLDPGVAFLQKPFTPATFARAIREALEARK
jgi:two-component system cell cycle sensor histidine kinase/response regulator CckA